MGNPTGARCVCTKISVYLMSCSCFVASTRTVFDFVRALLLVEKWHVLPVPSYIDVCLLWAVYWLGMVKSEQAVSGGKQKGGWNRNWLPMLELVACVDP